jgi:hypothetical protein
VPMSVRRDTASTRPCRPLVPVPASAVMSRRVTLRANPRHRHGSRGYEPRAAASPACGRARQNPVYGR